MPNHLFTGLCRTDRPGVRICVISPDGSTLSYDDVLGEDRELRGGARGGGREAGRPRGGAGRQVERGAVPLSRLRARRRGVPAAQPGLHAGRARVFHRRRRAGAGRRRARPARGDGGACGEDRRARRDAGLAGDGTLPALACSRRRAAWRDVERGPDDLAAMLYTSGTTGRPKGAMLTPRESALQRRGAGRGVALHAGRRADPRAADLPHARPVRGDQRDADGGRRA